MLDHSCSSECCTIQCEIGAFGGRCGAVSFGLSLSHCEDSVRSTINILKKIMSKKEAFPFCTVENQKDQYAVKPVEWTPFSSRLLFPLPAANRDRPPTSAAGGSRKKQRKIPHDVCPLEGEWRRTGETSPLQRRTGKTYETFGRRARRSWKGI